ncbi:MAG: hypothetical protein IPI67_08145 [Myxococcales bacterium]|nr:hypothetical protein [Myxococcales bacterium]
MRELFIALGDDQDEPAPGPRAQLDALAIQLRVHFAAEEDPEYFGTIAAECPALGGQVENLQSAHAALLRAAEHLRTLAAAPGGRRVLALLITRLEEDVRAHEAAEGRLLSEFFGLP